MIEGASSRVPSAGHWDLYRSALQRVPGLVGKMSDAIVEYIDELIDEIPEEELELDSSAMFGKALKKISNPSGWRAEFGPSAKRLFGMILWVAIYDDHRMWDTDNPSDQGRDKRTYWPIPRN